MTKKFDQQAQKVLCSIQGGKYWDGETRLENMIKILEELIRKTINTKSQEKGGTVKLQRRLLLILKTLEHHNFDVHTSSLEYLVPGIIGYEFEFNGFIYEAVLNFNLVTNDEKKSKNPTHCSYKFVHIDGSQENLAQLVDKYERTKSWREIKDSFYRESAIRI